MKKMPPGMDLVTNGHRYAIRNSCGYVYPLPFWSKRAAINCAWQTHRDRLWEQKMQNDTWEVVR